MKPQRPRILAIDDNPQNIITIATALEADFDFQLASSGPEGLALAAQAPPDLILLDVMLPDVDGFETCRRFKAQPALSAIPIIFLTALSDLETEVLGLALGAADYITKPINIELVRQRIGNLLRLTQLTVELRASEERLRLVMEAIGEGVWDWNIAAGTVVHNVSWCRILGLDQSFLAHPLQSFVERIHPDDLSKVQLALDACLSGAAAYVSEHRLRAADGSFVWVLDRGNVVERGANGQPLRMVGSVQNIDQRKWQEAEIHRLAFFDPLTKLPNRRLLLDRLQGALQKNRRSQQFGALMFLDMDRFKQLNDTHGHAMGDALLVQVASRMQACLREQDTVARLGGDEFVAMFENLSESPQTARLDAFALASKILGALNQPFLLGNVDHALSYTSTPSIGLTLFNGEDDVEEVLKRADLAMYEAKNGGRNTIRVFDQSACSGDWIL